MTLAPGPLLYYLEPCSLRRRYMHLEETIPTTYIDIRVQRKRRDRKGGRDNLPPVLVVEKILQFMWANFIITSKLILSMRLVLETIGPEI